MSLIQPPDPDWPDIAALEIARWTSPVPGIIALHHIGSTSVPGLPAKPTIDLLPVFVNRKAKLEARDAVEALGYDWMGEHGLPGRAYARLADRETGQRQFHAHGYAAGHPDVARHLAFRDVLRQNAALRAAYTSVKAACAAQHPEGGSAYQHCKRGWIDKIERLALERLT